MDCKGLLLKEADGAQEEQEESRKAIERDRREAARALMEWQERAQQASALEARLAAREAALREREDSFEAQVRPLNTVSSYNQPRGCFNHQIFSHLARQASHLSEAVQCRAASAGLFTPYFRLLGYSAPLSLL